MEPDVPNGNGVRISNAEIYRVLTEVRDNQRDMSTLLNGPRGVMATQADHETRLAMVERDKLTGETIRKYRRALYASVLSSAAALTTVLYTLGHLH